MSRQSSTLTSLEENFDAVVIPHLNNDLYSLDMEVTIRDAEFSAQQNLTQMNLNDQSVYERAKPSDKGAASSTLLLSVQPEVNQS